MKPNGVVANQRVGQAAYEQTSFLASFVFALLHRSFLVHSVIRLYNFEIALLFVNDKQSPSSGFLHLQAVHIHSAKLADDLALRHRPTVKQLHVWHASKHIIAPHLSNRTHKNSNRRHKQAYITTDLPKGAQIELIDRARIAVA